MSFINIRTALKALIDGIKTSAGIADTFDYEPAELTSTPAVALVLDNSSEAYASNSQNWLNANWLIRCYVERTTDDSGQTTLLLGVADAVLNMLRVASNDTLSGNSVLLLATSILPVTAGAKGNLNVLFCDIRVEVKAFKAYT